MIERYDISAYCHRCGSTEGSNAVVVSYDKDKDGEWVKYEDIQAKQMTRS